VSKREKAHGQSGPCNDEGLDLGEPNGKRKILAEEAGKDRRVPMANDLLPGLKRFPRARPRESHDHVEKKIRKERENSP